MGTNVQDFGAVGDGTTDDTAAIQAAINASPSLVFFPATSAFYKVTTKITLKDSTILEGEGAYASRVVGNFADYVFEHDTPAISGGHIAIERLGVINQVNGGGALHLSDVICALVRDCYINAGIGIYTKENLFTGRAENTRFLGLAGAPAGTVGLLGGLAVDSCDIVGFDHGIRAWGAWPGARNSRFEVNRVGIMVGLNDQGNNHICHGAQIAGNYGFEANDTGIWLNMATGVSVSGETIYGTVNSPSQGSKYGLRIGAVKRCDISAIQINGGFSEAGVEVSKFPGYPENLTIRSVWSQNTLGPAWNLWTNNGATWADVQQHFSQCNQPVS